MFAFILKINDKIKGVGEDVTAKTAGFRLVIYQKLHKRT